MTVEIEHVFFADTSTGAAAIMENAIAHGADEVRAVWDDKAHVYRVEYKTDDDTEEAAKNDN